MIMVYARLRVAKIQFATCLSLAADHSDQLGACQDKEPKTCLSIHTKIDLKKLKTAEINLNI